MSEDRLRNNEVVDDEINIWELIERLKSGWYWLVSGSAIGLIGAIGFLIFIPEKYEAIAVIQPATVGMVVATTTTTTIEPIAQTLERLKLVTFYSNDLVKTCQALSAKNLTNDVKAKTKSNNLLSISYRAHSPHVAEACVANIVIKLTQSQANIGAPLLRELESQQALTKGQIDDIERLLAHTKKREFSFGSNEMVLLLILKDELNKLQRLHREQRIQLSEPLTRPMRLLEPIDVQERAVKLIACIVGLISGLLGGLLALFIARSWRHYSSIAP
jgi:uncharacterized protein involved in exopolysaccharide biosynthesis